MFRFLESGSFHLTKLNFVNFEKASCFAVSFYGTVFQVANFNHSNVKRTSFQGAFMLQVHFSYANLYENNFINSAMAPEQFEGAFSIQDALMPNGTQAQVDNLINNGKANCNISSVNGWKLKNGSITVVESNHSNSYCEFILQSVSSGATIYQRVNLSNKWNSSLWPYSQAVLRANVSIGISMELKEISYKDEILVQRTSSTFISNSSAIKFILYA